MTIIKYGDNLSSPVPQPGWTVEQDGFGLLTARVTYKWAKENAEDFPQIFEKGVTPAPPPYAHLKLWKATMTVEKGEILTVVADFTGIDLNINSGQFSNMQVAMVGSSASEAIEHHPNFAALNCESITSSSGKPLAGFPPLKGGFDESTTNNPNRALWTPQVSGGGVQMGYQFVGFLPNQKASEYPDHINIKAGIKNYYKPATTLRCLFYHSNQTAALDLASYVGYCTDGTDVGLPAAYRLLATGGYSGSFTYVAAYESKINRTFLITNCSVEVFGAIYKVTMDLTLSGISGWDPDIYPVIQA